MNLKEYCFDNIFSIISFLLCCVLCSGLLWLIETPLIVILLLDTVLIIFFAVPFFVDYSKRCNYYNQLLRMLDKLDVKTLLAEVAEKPQFLDGQILSDILNRCNKYQNDKIAQIERINREYREFLDTWVHEIKTPITSARLIIENDKNSTTLRIDDELRKIDSFVELVLFYSRSTAVEKDFKVEKTSLQSLINIALKTYSKPIIQAGGHIYMDQLDIPLCVDIKSCSFVIGQIISNAIKYRKNNFDLYFFVKREKNYIRLCIKDNGIGIPPSDLSRIFDKGFTGENGRQFSKATGIGLYLCKRLCNKMNIIISVDSKANVGTTVSLDFPNESLLLEVG